MTSTNPIKALSLVQPWAWLIVSGIKNIENRTWPTKHTGWTYIHASQRRSCGDYDTASRLLDKHNKTHGTNHKLPMFNALDRGAIVGLVYIRDCVAASDSLWFFGPYGFLVSEAKPLEPIPCKGALGFFVPPVQSLAVIS